MTPVIKVMFVIGTIVFLIYLYALCSAILWGHNSQEDELVNDPELRNYYDRHGTPE